MAQERVSITFHLVPGKDKDDDLIEMLQEVRGADRAQLIKSRLRGQPFNPTQQERVLPIMPDYSLTLDDLGQRVYWLQEHMHKLPETIEQMIARLTAISSANISPSPPPPPKERASKESLERRKERTQKQAW